MKSSICKLNILILISLLLFSKGFAQCPTVNNNSQVLCNIESLLVSDLEAIDNGSGIAWFDTATSTTPLDSSLSLVNGENYFADNSSGNCGSRQEVVLTILGAPLGLNFQGVCVENALDATIADLEVTGNDVQWYLSAEGDSALNTNTVLMDETIYYADQSNPMSNCRTSRLAVLVIVGIVPAPQGDNLQQYCANADNIPTVADLVASGNNNWYLSESSASPLDLDTPLVDGSTYFATTIDPPCESDSRLMVTVELIFQNSAGTDGTLDICEDDTTIYDLIDSLNGSPDAGGTWSPALNSGTGILNPTIDTEGIYTYTVSSNTALCEDTSASVTVSILAAPNAGTDGTLEICENDSNTYDLFDSLNGSPDTGGTWSPALNSGTGFFDPAIDSEGLYTYTVLSGNSTCNSASTSVTVSFEIPPNPGADGSLQICEDDTTTYDLFDSLNGSPDTNGTWSPALNSGTGFFDPAIDTEGFYTYTVTGITVLCEDASAAVTVSIFPTPNAGSEGALEICENDINTYDLFDSLNGSPDTGGTWSPALNSGTGIFDPAIDSEGPYTYTVLSGNPVCNSESTSVTVSFEIPPNPGADGTLQICEDDTTTYDLFDSLNGSPDANGTWSPALNSGTGFFDPTIDTEGIYTYTVIGITVLCEDASASVTVSIFPTPNAGSEGALEICENDTNTYDLFDSLNGSPDTGGTWSPALNSGTGIFDSAIDTVGIYTYIVTSSNPVCNSASTSVTVSFEIPPNPGADGTLQICEDDTTTYDLFDSLNGSPDTGGTWSPALNSGTGIFDPAIDTESIYTYTVFSNNALCEEASASVTVSILPAPNAGTDGTLEICENDTNTYDLFDSLNGSPDTGGTWSPALNSGTGIFDSAIDTVGIYTYTVTSSNPICNSESTSVTVSFEIPPNPGSDGTLQICEDDTTTYDLFDSLNGSPDIGGTWSPGLNSGTGIFDPAIDTEGIYSYTVFSNNSLCDDASASVTVSILPIPDAGTNGTLAICEDDSNTYDLFDSLSGSPDAGGTWSPALNSGTGIFDPAIDTEGLYTYTIFSNTVICEDVSSSVTVSTLTPPNAGTDGTLEICEDDITTYDLFDSLNGSPDLGGTWSPALNSGTGIFDPAIDTEGIYTYTIDLVQCMQTDTSEILVSLINLPNLEGLSITVLDTCKGIDLLVTISNASELTDGDYTINFEITGSNLVNQNVIITIINGVGSFTINSNLFINAGSHQLVINSISSVLTSCNGDVSKLSITDFIIFDSITPILIEDGNSFCVDEDSSIGSISSNIFNADGFILEWYDALEGGTIYNSETQLEDGMTYYASIISDEGCESFTRLAVTVSITDCFEDIIIPDGFSPNNDSVNETFNIRNLDILYPNFKITIFNRFGNKLYQGNINSPQWDGTSSSGRSFGDNQLPVGVYFFILEFNDGIREELQGRVYLNR